MLNWQCLVAFDIDLKYKDGNQNYKDSLEGCEDVPEITIMYHNLGFKQV